jgi:predicted membrane-bound spermidine synthase
MGFLLGIIVDTLIVVAAIYYAVYIGEHHPENYHGLWRYLGIFGHTPRVWGGIIVGLIVGVVITYVMHLIPTHPLLFVLDLLIGVVIVLAVGLAVTLYQLRKKDNHERSS